MRLQPILTLLIPALFISLIFGFQGSAESSSLTGRILDTNDFVQGLETPVTGKKISILGTGISSVTDDQGHFTLDNVPAGYQVLKIDTPANAPAPDGAGYGGFQGELKISAGSDEIRERPFFLPRIDAASLTPVDPAMTTVVDNSSLNVSVTVPPFSAQNEDGSPFTGNFSISEIPEGLTPVPLPEGLRPGLVLTLQPLGVRFTTPVEVTLANTENFAPGSEVDIWSLNHTEGVFMIVGKGRVSFDGLRIETFYGGVRESGWFFVLAPPVRVTPDRHNVDEKIQPPDLPIALHSGNLTVSHTLAAYRSLAETRAPKFIYNSLLADPRPIINFDTTIVRRAPVPHLISTRLKVAAEDHGTEVFTSTRNLAESIDEDMRHAVQFDAGDFKTGEYPYEITLSSYYANSSVASVFKGHLIVNNQKASPFGAGWGMEGLQRLFLDEEENVLITDGSGTERLFKFVTPGDEVKVTRSFEGANIQELRGAAITTEDKAPVSSDNSSLIFNGTGEHVNIKGTEDLNFEVGSPMSIALWLKETAPRTVTHIFGKREECQAMNYQVAYDAGALHFNSSAGRVSTGRDIPPDQWMHLAVAYDGVDTLTIFIDGEEVTRREHYVIQGTNAAPLKFGTSGTCADVQSFVGLMDEIKIYRRAITREEAAALAGLAEEPSEFYLSPAGDFSTLRKNPDRTFSRVLKDGTIVHFNTHGYMTAREDRNGNTTRYTYDIDGRLRTIQDPLGAVTVFHYAGNHLASVTDPAGRVTLFDHDAGGNLTRVTDPDGTSRQFTYDAQNRMVTEISKRNFKTRYFYDFAGRYVQLRRPEGSSYQVASRQTIGLIDPASAVGTRNNPAPVTRPAEVFSVFTDAKGERAMFAADNFGTERRMIDSLGRTTVTVHDGNGSPIKIIRPDGTIAMMHYDLKGNLLSLRRPDINITTDFRYDLRFNQIISLKDANGNRTEIAYDSRGNPAILTDALNQKTFFDYSAEGLLTRVTNALNQTAQFTYDINGHLTTVTHPDGKAVHMAYNAAGYCVATTDQEGKTTQLRYDPLNRVTEVIDHQGGMIRYDYDEDGNLIKIADFKSRITLFEYDAQNRLTAMTNPQGFKETFSYDGNGNVASFTDRNQQTVKFQYDAANRVVAKIFPNHRTRTLTYDMGGQITEVNDSKSKLSFVYDQDGRLINASTVGSFHQPEITIDYTYDANGNRLTMRGPTLTAGTGVTRYTYDALNRLTALTNPWEQTVQFQYDALGRRTQTMLPKDINRSRSYGDTESQRKGLIDQLQKVQAIVKKRSSLDYVYEAMARFAKPVNPLPETVKDSRAFALLSGDLLTSPGDALPVLSDEAFVYKYDRNGNLIQKKERATNVVTDYAYDAENRLVKVRLTDGHVTQYQYDGLGRMIEQDAAGIVTRYVYDHDQVLLEFNGINTPLAGHTHGLNPDEPLMIHKGGISYYYQLDDKGNVVGLRDESGEIIQSSLNDIWTPAVI